MKVVFWGTPETAVPFLERLLKNHQVQAVVTQPDKPAHRGQSVQKSPVKLLAEKNGIPVFQPSDLRDPSFITSLKETGADAGVVVAYGRILPPPAIAVFSKGIYNIHFSLLPDLRGAAPIQWAILRGLKKSGVCSFKISETLDTGEIFSKREVALAEDETAVSLEAKLIPPGLDAMDETLQKIKSGNLTGEPQKGTATAAPRIQKEDAKINWSSPALDIDRKIRALARLGAFCTAPDGKNLKILAARPMGNSPNLDPGTLAGIEDKKGFVIKCGQGSLLVLRVRPEGKNEMDAWAYLQGHAFKPGARFS